MAGTNPGLLHQLGHRSVPVQDHHDDIGVEGHGMIMARATEHRGYVLESIP